VRWIYGRRSTKDYHVETEGKRSEVFCQGLPCLEVKAVIVTENVPYHNVSLWQTWYQPNLEQ
jgi:hypothetical protein